LELEGACLDTAIGRQSKAGASPGCWPHEFDRRQGQSRLLHWKDGWRIMKPHLHFRLLLGICFFCQAFFAHAEPERPGIVLEVKKNGETVIVDAHFAVSANQHEVWDVLTDFDHMAKFLPNLESSKVLAGGVNKVQVEQKGRITYGLLSFSFENIRDVELSPYQEIRSHLVSGNLKKGEGMTQLISEGSSTRVVYHNESLPGSWLGAAVSLSVIEKASREQFEAIKNEILRRKSAGNGDVAGAKIH
jgi:carbon monoxide dehydrogenase subunit G